MSALRRLPLQGRQACEELAATSPWSAEEWARSVRCLATAGLYPAIGLADVARISRASGVPPLDVADTLVIEAARVLQRERAVERARDHADPG